MHGGLIFLEISGPVEPMILEISCVDLVRHLKLSLVEDLVEHSSSYCLVSGFPGRHIWDVIGSGYRSERREGKKKQEPRGVPQGSPVHNSSALQGARLAILPFATAGQGPPASVHVLNFATNSS